MCRFGPLFECFEKASDAKPPLFGRSTRNLQVQHPSQMKTGASKTITYYLLVHLNFNAYTEGHALSSPP
ncbi:MAG: hypothetical protein KIH01_04950 [Candidatus Freyarchaeota archaeon]|nr:hypothetical protein [Candidatus Jordarchaeia archaeon]